MLGRKCVGSFSPIQLMGEKVAQAGEVAPVPVLANEVQVGS